VPVTGLLQVTQANTENIGSPLGIFGSTGVWRDNGEKFWVAVAHLSLQAI
jgi:hypothetical protein